MKDGRKKGFFCVIWFIYSIITLIIVFFAIWGFDYSIVELLAKNEVVLKIIVTVNLLMPCFIWGYIMKHDGFFDE